MAGVGKRPYASAQRSLSVTISSVGERPTRWLVSYRHNEKGDDKQVEMTVDTGEWASRADSVDDHIKALAWLARKLWAEMEARNG